MWRRTSASRSTGSSIPTGRDAYIAEARLVASCRSAGRIDTGTMVRTVLPSSGSAGRLEKSSQPARRDGQDDVIDCAPQRFADDADIGERHRCHPVVPVGTEGASEHGWRRAGCAEQQAQAAPDLGQSSGRGHRMTGGVA